MKRLLLFSILSSTTLNSQIVLQKTDFATGGDTVRMSVSNNTTLDFSTTGLDHSWDFSNLTPSSQKIKDFRPNSQFSTFSSFLFGSFAPTSYKASYFIESTDLPVAQLTSALPITIDNIFQFSKVSNDSITSVGYSMVVNGTEIPFKSDTIEKRYQFPIQIGNTTSSRGYTNVDLNPTYDAIFRQHRKHDSEVDGWGSITTPYGTFNALRIKHTITELDSVYVGAFSFWLGLPLPQTNQYEWWTNGQKEPILRINTTTAGGNETITSVEYRDSYRGLDAGITELNNNDFLIFPNPIQNQLTISSLKPFDNIQIIDISGKLIRDISFSESTNHTLNLIDLSNGIYSIKIISDNSSSIKSFIKQ